MPTKAPTAKTAPPPKPNAEALRQAARPTLRPIAPGKWVAEPGRNVPQYCIATVTPNKDGHYSVAPLPEKMLRLNARLLNALGLSGQWDTLRRLARAGFIELVRMGPSCTLLNLDSYYNHLRRVSEDPDFWEPGKGNLEAYRESL